MEIFLIGFEGKYAKFQFGGLSIFQDTASPPFYVNCLFIKYCFLYWIA